MPTKNPEDAAPDDPILEEGDVFEEGEDDDLEELEEVCEWCGSPIEDCLCDEDDDPDEDEVCDVCGFSEEECICDKDEEDSEP